MKYQERLPHSSLQDYVKCFWILEREYTPENPNLSGQTSLWSFLTREAGNPTKGEKQMTTENPVGAAPDAKMNRPAIAWRQVHRNIRRLQARIVKAASRVPRRALERLERHMAKVIRAALSGGGHSNAASLPDPKPLQLSLLFDLPEHSFRVFSLRVQFDQFFQRRNRFIELFEVGVHCRHVEITVLELRINLN
jgi:hypothetical protein